jgi:hypothetical protein
MDLRCAQDDLESCVAVARSGSVPRFTAEKTKGSVCQARIMEAEADFQPGIISGLPVARLDNQVRESANWRFLTPLSRITCTTIHMIEEARPTQTASLSAHCRESGF